MRNRVPRGETPIAPPVLIWTPRGDKTTRKEDPRDMEARNLVIGTLVTLLVLSAGCATTQSQGDQAPSGTDREYKRTVIGALAGAAVGAGAGALIAGRGHRGTGALIGGAGGAL